MVRLVLDSEESVFDGTKKLLAQGVVGVRECVEGERCSVVRISDGRCFGASRAGRDDGRCARIERGDDFCGQKSRIDGGGEVEAQVAEGAADKVGGDGRRLRVQELMHLVKRGVCWLPVDRWYVCAFEALDELVNGGGCHGGG